jgi:hypothetical protein
MTTLHEVMGSDPLYIKRTRATLTIQFGFLEMPPRHLAMFRMNSMKPEEETAFSCVHTARVRDPQTHSLCYRLCTGCSFCGLKYPKSNAIARGCHWSTAPAPSRWRSPGLRWRALLGHGLVKPSTSMEKASRSTSLWPITSTLHAPLQNKQVKAALGSKHNCCLLWIIRNTFVYTFTSRGTYSSQPTNNL